MNVMNPPPGSHIYTKIWMQYQRAYGFPKVPPHEFMDYIQSEER